MAKTTIKPESETPIESQSSAVVPTASAAPANYNPNKYDDESRDVERASIGLINKIGPLSKKFPKNAGEFAFTTGQSGIVVGETALVIPVGFAKSFVESMRNGKALKFGEQLTPPAKTFSSANEAYQAGYTADWDSNHPNKVEEAGKVAYLVRGPKDDRSGEFYLSAPDGNAYAIAIGSYRRGSHKGTYKPVYSHAYRLGQAQGISAEETKFHNFPWKLSAEHIDNAVKQQDWYETRIQKVEPLSPEMVAWIDNNVGKYAV